MVELKELVEGALEANRDFQRNIIPQPRSPEVTLHSPWEAPTLGIAFRRFEKNVGAVDTAIRTARGDIAREKLRRISDEEFVNVEGIKTKHSSEMLIRELREYEDVDLEDLHELLSTQGGDLNLDGSYASLSAGLGRAYFEANPNDQTVDLAKIPEKYQYYTKTPQVSSLLEKADRSRIKALKKDAIAANQEAYFRNNLGMVVDAVRKNRMVHPIGRVTLSNYLKHETGYWQAEATQLDASLSQLEVPHISEEQVDALLWDFEEPGTGQSEMTPDLINASQYYALRSKVEAAKKNAVLYDKFQKKLATTLENDYKPQPGTESETAGYHPYNPPRYVDGVRVKFVDGKPMPSQNYAEATIYYPRPGAASETSGYGQSETAMYGLYYPRPGAASETSGYGS